MRSWWIVVRTPFHDMASCLSFCSLPAPVITLWEETLKEGLYGSVDVANMRRARGTFFHDGLGLSGTLDEKDLSVVLKRLSPDAKTRGSLPQGTTAR